MDGEVFEVGTVTATRAVAADIVTIRAFQTGLDPFEILMTVTSPAVGTTIVGTDFAATIIDGTGARDPAIVGSITITAISATSIEGTAAFNGNTHGVTGVAFRLPVTSAGP